MFKYIFIFFLVYAFPSNALHRDIELKDQNEFSSYFCRECMTRFRYGKDIWPEIDKYTYLIPFSSGKRCDHCWFFFKRKRDGVYAPYLSMQSKEYFEMLQDHLVYVSNHSTCKCYWPELNVTAAEISDMAYELFFDLFTKSPLSIVTNDKEEQNKLLLSHPWSKSKFSARGIVILLINKAFFFSHYCKICEDFDKYSRSMFDDDEYYVIHEKIENIKTTLASLFIKQYNICLSKHAHKRIEQEKKIAMQFLESPSESMLEALNFESAKKVKPGQSPHGKLWANLRDWRCANILLEQGHLLNSLLLYSDAIDVLTVASRQNPTNPDIFIERAIAYFETNQLSLAIKDYSAAKQLAFTPPFKINEKGRKISYDAELNELTPIFDELFELNVGEKPFSVSNNKIHFTKGLIQGTVKGAKEATEEFIPSLMSCCRGIFHGLWAFACSPEEVSLEVVHAAYELGIFISSHSTSECLQSVIPELKDLALSWDKIDEVTKGHKIGYIIGKYGIDIFAPIAAIKGVKGWNQIRTLQQATAKQTLEFCAVSQSKQAIILEESVKRAHLGQSLVIESAKKGKILIKSPNVKYHIIQKKHGWDKVVKISGNVEEDFAKVVAFIEENNIISQKYFFDTIEFPINSSIKKIQQIEYRALINGKEIRSFTEKYLETGEIFLQNAWVTSK